MSVTSIIQNSWRLISSSKAKKVNAGGSGNHTICEESAKKLTEEKEIEKRTDPCASKYKHMHHN